MKRIRFGITMLEVLVCISIVMIVAAIMYPIIIRAKGSAQMAKTKSNLRQVHLMLSMYSLDYDVSSLDNLSSMGYPPHALYFQMLSKHGLKSPLEGRYPGFRTYYLLPPMADAPPQVLQDWKIQTSSCAGQSVVAADFNFSDVNPEDFSMFLTKRAVGISADGSIRIRSRFGFPFKGSWWKCP